MATATAIRRIHVKRQRVSLDGESKEPSGAPSPVAQHVADISDVEEAARWLVSNGHRYEATTQSPWAGNSVTFWGPARSMAASGGMLADYDPETKTLRVFRKSAVKASNAQFARAIILALSDLPPAKCKPVRMDNGVPVYRFKKQIIRCGNFTTADGQPFEVTPKTLKLWLSDWHSMKAHDVPVPVPNKHDATGADENHGFVVDMALSNDGKGIDATIELYGEDAPKLAASNHCSIYADPGEDGKGWEDGDGNRYRWPIRHVALTPDPRITGLTGFIPIAASNIPIARIKIMARRIRLNAQPSSVSVPGTGYGESPAGAGPNGNDDHDFGGDGTEGDPIDMIIDAIEQESLPKIRAASDRKERVRLAKEMADKIDKALSIFEDDLSDDGDLGDEIDGTPSEPEGAPIAASNQGDKWCAIQANIDKTKRRHAAMSNAAIHPELIRLSNQNRTMQIENLWRERKINAHQRKQLLAKFTGEGPVRLALSNAAAAQSFEGTLAILAANVPAQSESSGIQVLDNPLALDNSGQPKDPETKKAVDYMHSLIGMGTK